MKECVSEKTESELDYEICSRDEKADPRMSDGSKEQAKEPG